MMRLGGMSLTLQQPEPSADLIHVHAEVVSQINAGVAISCGHDRELSACVRNFAYIPLDEGCLTRHD